MVWYVMVWYVIVWYGIGIGIGMGMGMCIVSWKPPGVQLRIFDGNCVINKIEKFLKTKHTKQTNKLNTLKHFLKKMYL